VVHGLHDSRLHHIVRALEGENGLQPMERDIDMELDPEGYMEDDMQDDEGEIEYRSVNIMLSILKVLKISQKRRTRMRISMMKI
jgi:hypothetical protein